MYCDQIFIQILHDKLLLHTMKSPHRGKKKKIAKVDECLFFFFFSFLRLMETRTTPLSLYNSVIIAPGTQLAGAGPLLPRQSKQVL